MLRTAGVNWIAMLLALAGMGGEFARGAGLEKSSPELEHFERHVRPVLVEHCIGCHGPKKQQGGLRLDSAAALAKGSDNGLIVVDADPEQSTLALVLSHEGSTKMPPKGKLPQPAIDAITAWVRAGTPWPKDLALAPPVETPQQVAAKHWAFQPIVLPAVPKVASLQADAQPASPVDAFLLAKLEASQLPAAEKQMNPPADKRTLLRRATFDLHGLPPTAAELAAFEADPSPEAFARVVDRLLASPRYGERWGRHWLDVARYADTKGYVRLNENPNYVASWPYRDYVIRAFNEDLPYDRFLVEQLAADLLPQGDDPRPLAAMGFLTLGQRFINSQHDIIDDRIDVVTRGLMGLTVTCARCHDHKFDPVPTRDYYSLHGVFANSLEPRVPPLALLPTDRPKYERYLTELESRTHQLNAFLRERQTALNASFRARASEYLLAAQREALQDNFLAVMFLIDAAKDLNPVMTQRWKRFLVEARRTDHPVLGPWHALAELAPEKFAEEAAALVAQWKQPASGAANSNPGGAGNSNPDAAAKFNSLVVEALAKAPPRDLAEAAARYGELFQQADSRWQALLKSDNSATALAEPEWEAIRQLLYGPTAPAEVPLDEIEEYFFVDTTTQQQLHTQQRNVEDWIASAGAAPHAPVLVDADEPRDARVFVRGNPSTPGDVVPRQFVEVLCRGERRPFAQGSGRLDLARAIASPENPLTARVLVNRVWLHHFGAGLVRTPGDFGLRGEPPTHPELLDYLAARFMAGGWSIKKLHRLVMLSAAYQQQATERPAAHTADPTNTLLWKAHRRRLDWEGLRDSLLFVAGNLDETRGGPSVDLLAQPFSARRTVYGFIDRQNLPGLMRTFDFTPPDATSPQRHETSVPQQALFLMNGPFMKQQVQRLAQRKELTEPQTFEERVKGAYPLIYQRAPTPAEVEASLAFLNKNEPPADAAAAEKYLSRWEEYLQVLLLANEFVFVD